MMTKQKVDWSTILISQGSPMLTRESDDILTAISWAVLRQEMFMAAMHQTPVGTSINLSKLGSIGQGDDHALSNQMLLNLMETLDYCFGDDKSTATYDRLLHRALLWKETLPESFTPVMYSRRRKGETFPQIWFLNDCIATGVQYFQLVRILLIVHDPRFPRTSRSQKVATQWVDVSLFPCLLRIAR